MLDQVLQADRSTRAALWAQCADVDQSSLAVVLLRSLPGHPGYDPVAARQGLQAIARDSTTSTHERRLAQLRLQGMTREQILSTELLLREARLKSLVDVERQLRGDHDD